MNPEQSALARSIYAHQEQMAASLSALTGETPDFSGAHAGAGIEDQGTPAPNTQLAAATARLELARQLKKLSTPEILQLFSLQARKRDAGVPLDAWLGGANQTTQYGFEAMQGQLVPATRKALDTNAVSALIRQDLEPFLYEFFVRLTPAYDRIAKEPANGLVHAWNKVTDFGDAQFMAELGTVTDDNSQFGRDTTNVAILATRRGISLKAAFAVPAGGMGYNPEQVELTGAMRAMSFKMQRTIFGGHATDSGGSASNELGAYDANGFTGLRSILNTARAENVDPATSPTTTGNIQRAIDAAIEEIVQTGGGMPTILWSHPTEKRTFNYQQDEKTRIVVPNQVNIGVGVQASTVNTIAGELPWAIVPGDSIGNYTATTYSSNNVRDLYLLDESTINLPYLGAPGPTVLDIPIGISGQLTHLYIVFLMNGLAVKAIPFSNKVRVKVA